MEIIPVGSTSFQHEGSLDDQKFYSFAKETLKKEGYNVVETSYVQFGGNNYHIEWLAQKALDDYMAYRINVVLDFSNITETSVMKEGKPIKAKTGKVIVQLVSTIILDFLNKWTGGVSKFVKPLYDRMNSETMTQRKEAFENELDNIKNTLQSSLSFQAS
ncbi:hypothetical protein IHE51_00590 [Candidatus Parvarchaeota archaeon]|jgi:hypothetical protein|uniref:Uncharacterized protein n=1 Tax=Candidatus Acidifodinimicrobium mancum TaxID=2898728 RepID=A0A8T3URQ6_9ARCH|nr:hypothetical protein [Candidatus Acidifodinimicrobium mancum]MBE5728890.1 hypothetical protein [Candidatus Acidifodinimicrobium mancum]MBE5729371.1 hypothetical protein [Candidatus Acidifodinimicrobium mancum]MBE5729737.1 hypothetical protein [Candidatus Acidifodinimicrobium mancum]